MLVDERGSFGPTNEWHLKGQKNNQHLSLSKEIKFQKNSNILMKKCHSGRQLISCFQIELTKNKII